MPPGKTATAGREQNEDEGPTVNVDVTGGRRGQHWHNTRQGAQKPGADGQCSGGQEAPGAEPGGRRGSA